MIFKNRDKFAFQRLSAVDRLEGLFLNRVLPQFETHDVSYVKSKRCLRFKNDLFHLEINWEQGRYNPLDSDTQFGMQCRLYSTPYRKWEKTYYQLTKSLIGTPIDMRAFHRLDSFDSSDCVHGRYTLSFKTQKKIAAIVSNNINSHLTDYFAAFENWDDKAISMLENTKHVFRQTVPLVSTDFLILQDRFQEAWDYLDKHDAWYKEFLEREKNGGEGLNSTWGPPYYARKEKLAAILGLKYTPGKLKPNPEIARLAQLEADGIPAYPETRTREQAREIKRRNKVFQDALKAAVKGTGWRFAGGTIFKSEKDWFVSNMPGLGFGRGAYMRWTCKPMAIDPLYWDILGLEGAHDAPLSFRHKGAWTIHPAWTEAFIAHDETSPERLAEEVLAWSNRQLENKANMTLEKMISDLGALDKLGHYKTQAVCLLILNGDLDHAEELCRNHDPKETVALNVIRPGQTASFYEQTLAWIADNN